MDLCLDDKSCSATSFSAIFDIEGSMLIGLQLLVSVGSPDLRIDVIMESFQESGKTPAFMESLIIFVSGAMKDCLRIHV